MSKVSLKRQEHRRFRRHYVEMLAAMVVGMAVLGALVTLFCKVTGHETLLDHPGASGPIMATNMTVGMALWMRHRGHDWRAIAEMAAAMYVPLLVLLVPFWIGVLPGRAFLSGLHVLMLPAMWIVMDHRRAEYSMDHHRHASSVPLGHAI